MLDREGATLVQMFERIGWNVNARGFYLLLCSISLVFVNCWCAMATRTPRTPMFSKGQNKGHDIFSRRSVVDVPSSAPNHNAHWRRYQELRDTECSTGIIKGNDDERYIISTPITTLLLLQLARFRLYIVCKTGLLSVSSTIVLLNTLVKYEVKTSPHRIINVY